MIFEAFCTFCSRLNTFALPQDKYSSSTSSSSFLLSVWLTSPTPNSCQALLRYSISSYLLTLFSFKGFVSSLTVTPLRFGFMGGVFFLDEFPFSWLTFLDLFSSEFLSMESILFLLCSGLTLFSHSSISRDGDVLHET